MLTEDFDNREGLRKNVITFREVYEAWHRNTQDGVLSEATAKASFHSMEIYMLPNIIIDSTAKESASRA